MKLLLSGTRLVQSIQYIKVPLLLVPLFCLAHEYTVHSACWCGGAKWKRARGGALQLVLGLNQGLRTVLIFVRTCTCRMKPFESGKTWTIFPMIHEPLGAESMMRTMSPVTKFLLFLAHFCRWSSITLLSTASKTSRPSTAPGTLFFFRNSQLDWTRQVVGKAWTSVATDG